MSLSSSLSSLFSSSASSPPWISSLVFWLKNPSPPWHAYKEVQAHISIMASTSLGLAWSSTDTRALDHFQYVIRSKRHVVRNSSRSQRCRTVTSCPPIWVRGPMLCGLRCMVCFHAATCGCALATFSAKASFVGERFWRFGAAPILCKTSRNQIFWRASVSDVHSGWP